MPRDFWDVCRTKPRETRAFPQKLEERRLPVTRHVENGTVGAVGSLLMPGISIAPGLAGPTLKKGEKEAIKPQGRKGRR